MDSNHNKKMGHLRDEEYNFIRRFVATLKESKKGLGVYNTMSKVGKTGEKYITSLLPSIPSIKVTVRQMIDALTQRWVAEGVAQHGL